jgi:hypothetical protein
MINIAPILKQLLKKEQKLLKLKPENRKLQKRALQPVLINYYRD